MEEEYGYDFWYEVGTYHKTARYLMYVFNTVFFAFASALFAFCIWIRFDPSIDHHVRNVHFASFWAGVIVFMVAAVMVMTASFVGCCATRFWNMKLTILYAVLSAICFIMNLGGATYLLSIGLEATAAYPYIQEYFRNLIYRYNIDVDARRTVDIIQEYIGCCGGFSTGDWAEIHMPVPNSCRDQITGNQYAHSCAEVVSWYLEYRTGWVSGIALCMCFLQLFTLMFAYCLVRGIRERKTAYKDSLCQE